jgi:glycosyltransferase involved in cell wall biosynthesis
MAMGLPLVSTKITGTEEALGLDYPYFSEKKDPTSLANHLLQFINDADLRQSVGQMNRERVIREFSMAKMISSYEMLIALGLKSI